MTASARSCPRRSRCQRQLKMGSGTDCVVMGRGRRVRAVGQGWRGPTSWVDQWVTERGTSGQVAHLHHPVVAVGDGDQGAVGQHQRRHRTPGRCRWSAGHPPGRAWPESGMPAPRSPLRRAAATHRARLDHGRRPATWHADRRRHRRRGHRPVTEGGSPHPAINDHHDRRRVGSDAADHITLVLGAAVAGSRGGLDHPRALPVRCTG
jgi:hypothetical protein